MVDKPELIEQFKTEFAFLVKKARNSGLNCWQILKVMPELLSDLMLESEHEYWRKGGQ